MEGRDQVLEPLRSFTARSLGLPAETWRQFVGEEENQVLLGGFLSAADSPHLFLHRDPRAGLAAGLDFPRQVQTKVVCVSRTSREVITKENVRKLLMIQEVQGEDATSFISSVSEEVSCPLLSNPESSISWAAGVASEALRFMGRQKNEALVVAAQREGQSFLPPPDAVQGDAEGKLTDMKLLHACDWTIIEWAELVSDVLQQDSSQAVLDGLKPLPSEEFNFWKNRLKNLYFIQQQLMSRGAQQVASIVQRTQSVYWSTLRDIYRDVQEGLQEAMDVTEKLSPVQQKLEELQQKEYQQLGASMAPVMEEVRLLWIRSEFYCKPCRVVVLLQEVCNLLIQRSREFLRGQEVMRGLVLEPGPVLDDVTLVIWTLQNLKEAYGQSRTRLVKEKQSVDGDTRSCWDFPSHLVFVHLDTFLQRLQNIQEAFRASVQLYQLSPAVLSGVSGGTWTDVVQEVYQDFLRHVMVLSDCSCDPTDPDDQSFQLHLDQFQAQVSDLERQLVSVLSRALEDCSVSSAAKLVEMFGFILDRPLIQDQLRPHQARLLGMVLQELDQTELLFHSQREKSHTFSRFTSTSAARLCWTQQLHLRAVDTLNHYRTLQQMDRDSGESQLVLQRVQQILDLLQDFRDELRSDWSSQLDSDCGFILNQPLIQQDQQGLLGVSCSRQLEAVLRAFRCVSREALELRPHAARLFACRDDITRSFLSLSHMVSCYNQVVSGALQVELPLIQDQLQDLNQTLSKLQRNTWSSEGSGSHDLGVQQLVQQQKHTVLMFHSTVTEARANMDAMTHIIQGWAELHLLRRCADSLLGGGASEQSFRGLREEGQELLRLTQVNRSLYAAEGSSESWIRYLDHIDYRVQDGLFQLLLRSLHFLSDNMNPQSCSGVFLAVSLQLQETGSVFEPSVGVGLSELLRSVIWDVYAAAASLPPLRNDQSARQASLQQSPALSALEQEVMRHLQQVSEEAELLRAGLDRYEHLWQSDRTEAMQEFLTYSRHLGPEDLDPEEAPPTLKDFQREMEALHRLSTQVTHLDEVIVLQGWLQVDLQPFRDSLLLVIQDWTQLYTDYLLDLVTDSLQQVTQRCDDDEESSSSSFPLTETILLLEAAGVQLPEHLSAQLQC